MGLLTPSEGRILVDVPLDADGSTPGAIRSVTWRRRRFFHERARELVMGEARRQRREICTRCASRRPTRSCARCLTGSTPSSATAASVSGGERQRLSRARARATPRLILDEATSSLDSENEARIQQAIDKLHQQMTIVVITHRLSTIRGADTIHVVDRGRLVESGTWTDLVGRRTGRFRELCEAQGIDKNGDGGGRRLTIVGPSALPSRQILSPLDPQIPDPQIL
jgi:ATP-binding cassette subfamily C protein